MLQVVDGGAQCQTQSGAACRQEEAAGDLLLYAASLGVDLNAAPELSWIVREALHAPLPPGWTAHSTLEQCVYFFNDVDGQSTWHHPLDATYRELLEVVRPGRTLRGEALARAVEAHLLDAQLRAVQDLQHWSGPYASDEGEYFYHELHGVSVWHNPCQAWQDELALRGRVLRRCVLDSAVSDAGAPEDVPEPSAEHAPCSLMFHSARSQLDSLAGFDDLEPPRQMLSAC